MKFFHNHNGMLNDNYLSVFVVLDVFLNEKSNKAVNTTKT